MDTRSTSDSRPLEKRSVRLGRAFRSRVSRCASQRPSRVDPSPHSRGMPSSSPSRPTTRRPCGGASIASIHKGTKVYGDAIAKAQWASRAGVIKGVLWHQGESDTTSPQLASTYGKKLKQLVRDLRVDLKQPNLPFVVGNLAEFYGTGPEHNAPRRVQGNAHKRFVGTDSVRY